MHHPLKRIVRKRWILMVQFGDFVLKLVCLFERMNVEENSTLGDDDFMRKILILCFLLIFGLVLAGCQEQSKPDDRLKDYVKLWNKQTFDDMYGSYLSTETKDSYKKKDFVDRYKKIYEDAGVSDLKVSFKERKDDTDWDKKKEAEFPVTIHFNTSAGEVKYDQKVKLTKEERDDKEDWYVNWDPSFILPELEDGDKVGIDTITAQRGEIYDRNDQPLAVNGEAFQIGIVPGEFDESNLKKVADLLDTSEGAIKKELDQSWVQPEYFVPIKKLPLSERPLALEVIDLDGLYSKRVKAREYPFGEATAHLTGYIGKLTAEKLEKVKDKGYTANSLIGVSGTEEVFEDKLRGKDGQRLFLTKENGDEVTVAEQEVENGKNVKLTIDAELQKKIYAQMKKEPGTAAAMNPKTGEALALVSTPSFDPNEMILGISSDRYKELSEDPDKPLENRFQITYSPGSTMKGITASVGLKSGKLDPNKTYDIKGKTWKKDESWGNYKVVRVFDNDSSVDLESGLKFSDNIYFARVGLDMGADTFVKGLKENFGFGEDIPFEYPLYNSQVSNDGKIEKEVQLADSAFGQGQVLMNIVHLASAYGGIINDGNMMEPQLVLDQEPKVWKKEVVTKEQANMLQTDLRKVVSEGIATKANSEGKAIAGKTGTAEIKSEQGSKGRENGLFVSYDQNNPDMVLAMLLENVQDNGGSTHTVQVTKKFYDSLK